MKVSAREETITNLWVSTDALMLYGLTTVDAEMLFEVVFVLECFPTLQTFELPGLHALVQRDRTLG